MKTKQEMANEPEGDYMAEAPQARPYSEAVTDEHRKLLSANGIEVPEAK